MVATTIHAPRALRAAAAAVLLGAALAAPAAAQTRRGCEDCRTPRAAADEQADDLRRAARAVERDVARLERRERDAVLKRALADARAALRDLDPASPDAERNLARALNRLAAAYGRAGADQARYAELVGRVAGVQGAVASASAHAGARRTLVNASHGDERTGWLGIAYSGDSARRDAARGAYFLFRAYPVIASVDAGSPAEAAGLEAGDTIIAFGGRDVRGRRIYLADVLKPGEPLWVRVRRRGAVRETRVAVRRRPHTEYAVLRDAYAASRVREASGAALAPAGAGRVRVVRPGRVTTVAPASPRAPDAPRPPAPPAPTGLFIWSGPSVVAGAELARTNDDLRDALGVDGGVLVLDVGSGTPAAEAGLRAGDVILRAGGRSATTPARVQRAVEAGGSDRRVELEVARKGARRTVVIRW